MSSKKLHKYCRIYKWIETKDVALAGAIRDLCMEGALSAGRRSGVTFLYPSAAVRKKIVDGAYSPDPEKATQLLEAHIILSGVRTAADFRKGVGSRLGIKLEVESASESSITLKGGAKLKVANDFIPLRKDNIAVWEIESGEVPLEGPEFKTPPIRGRGEYSDKKSFSGGSSLNDRQILATNVEGAYNTCMRTDRCATKDPYLTHAVSLLNFLKTSHSDQLVKVLPIIDRDPAVTFYLLIEPYKTSGSEYILPNSILFGDTGWNGAEIYEGAVSEFKKFFEMIGQENSPSSENRQSGSPTVPYVFRDTQFVRSAIDNVRLQIIGDDGRHANKVNTPKAVHSVYEMLITENSIGGAQPIMPDDTLRALPGTKKLWQDELRFILHAAMQTIRDMPVYNQNEFAEVIRMLRNQRPGNNYSNESNLSNLELLQHNVAPQSEFAMLVKFINSTDFLYIPVSAAKVGGAWGEVPIASGQQVFLDPRDLRVYNAEVSKENYLRRAATSGQDSPRTLDHGSIAAIQHYINTHGRLPPGLHIVEAAG